MSLTVMIVTTDRGYGSTGLLKMLETFGICTIMVMPKHNLRCHPRIGRSYLDTSMCDESEESSAREVSDTSDGEEYQIETASQQKSHRVQFDRRATIF